LSSGKRPSQIDILMHHNEPFQQRSWVEKFRDAMRGIKVGVRGQSSFFVHFFVAAAVIATATVLKIDSLAEWSLLLLCIAVVLTAEMFNSALESLARAITDQADPNIEAALDIAAGAVLIASIGASLVGTVIFGKWLAVLIGWW
jgi:diacylglycerol kinase